MGQGNCLLDQNKKYSGKKYFEAVEQEYFKKYAEGDKIIATFELISVIGKK